eukprot:COSAG03_NODE_1364_length_4251_cov_4.775771_7_plen_89_part_00
MEQQVQKHSPSQPRRPEGSDAIQREVSSIDAAGRPSSRLSKEVLLDPRALPNAVNSRCRRHATCSHRIDSGEIRQAEGGDEHQVSSDQ